ncbi:hypothetical protein B0H13DRAFT_2450576 [Mycena leptocephala]|nr:hypothetical protein B0H13DRAFT_2450576 [Mycena leptocephala]
MGPLPHATSQGAERIWKGNIEQFPANATSWHSAPENYRRAGRFPASCNTRIRGDTRGRASDRKGGTVPECASAHCIGMTTRPNVQIIITRKTRGGKWRRWSANDRKPQDYNLERKHEECQHPLTQQWTPPRRLHPQPTRTHTARGASKCHRPVTSGRTRHPQWKTKAKKKGYEARLDAHNTQLRIVLKYTHCIRITGNEDEKKPGNETRDKTGARRLCGMKRREEALHTTISRAEAIGI